MKFLRNRRRLAAVGALAVMGAVTGFVVVPALASSPTDYVNPPALPSGVTPTDWAVGGNGTCSSFGITTGTGTGRYEIDVNNPKSGTVTSPNGDSVTLDLTVSTGKDKDKYFSFAMHGAGVLAVGVNGGTDSTFYDYRATSPVAGDGTGSGGGLHAPLQQNSYTTTTANGKTFENPTSGWSSFYSLSHLSFCYTFGTVSGTVYQDASPPDGTYTSGTDTGLQGWTINLYDSGGHKVGSTTSGSGGSYTVSAAFTPSTTYTLCEVPASGTWAQTEPASGAVGTCSGTGELSRGQTFTPTSAAQQVATPENFGNVPATACGTNGQVGPSYYTLGTCKPGQTYVFSQGTLDNGAPYVSYWVGDPTMAQQPTVERVNFPDALDANRQPTYTHILYSDDNSISPPSSSSLPTMPYCNLDPRSDSGFTLQSQYAVSSGSSAVLPGTTTSCVISIRTYVDGSGNGQLEGYIYSLADSTRSIG